MFVDKSNRFFLTSRCIPHIAGYTEGTWEFSTSGTWASSYNMNDNVTRHTKTNDCFGPFVAFNSK